MGRGAVPPRRRDRARSRELEVGEAGARRARSPRLHAERDQQDARRAVFGAPRCGRAGVDADPLGRARRSRAAQRPVDDPRPPARASSSHGDLFADVLRLRSSSRRCRSDRSLRSYDTSPMSPKQGSVGEVAVRMLGRHRDRGHTALALAHVLEDVHHVEQVFLVTELAVAGVDQRRHARLLPGPDRRPGRRAGSASTSRRRCRRRSRRTRSGTSSPRSPTIASPKTVAFISSMTFDAAPRRVDEHRVVGEELREVAPGAVARCRCSRAPST